MKKNPLTFPPPDPEAIGAIAPEAPGIKNSGPRSPTMYALPVESRRRHQVMEAQVSS
jgi:hypothetical protein